MSSCAQSLSFNSQTSFMASTVFFSEVFFLTVSKISARGLTSKLAAVMADDSMYCATICHAAPV